MAYKSGEIACAVGGAFTYEQRMRIQSTAWSSSGLKAWTRRGKAIAGDLHDEKTTIRKAPARIRSSVRGAVETDGGARICDSQKAAWAQPSDPPPPMTALKSGIVKGYLGPQGLELLDLIKAKRDESKC